MDKSKDSQALETLLLLLPSTSSPHRCSTSVLLRSTPASPGFSSPFMGYCTVSPTLPQHPQHPALPCWPGLLYLRAVSRAAREAGGAEPGARSLPAAGICGISARSAPHVCQGGSSCKTRPVFDTKSQAGTSACAKS